MSPLGLNAAQFAVRHHRRGLVSKPDGLGNPTPMASTIPSLHFPSSAFFAALRHCVKVSSRIPLSYVAPLGLWLFGACRRAINMSPRWG